MFAWQPIHRGIQYSLLPAQTAFHSPILSSLAMLTPCSMSILSCLTELALPWWTFFSCGGFLGVRRDLRWMLLPSEDKNPTYYAAFADFHIGWIDKDNSLKNTLNIKGTIPHHGRIYWTLVTLPHKLKMDNSPWSLRMTLSIYKSLPFGIGASLYILLIVKIPKVMISRLSFQW